jgi:hypothetical protein
MCRYRVTCDRAGRWHIAFTAIPEPVTGPGTGAVVGIDRGVSVSAALSTGQLLHCPGLRPAERPAWPGCSAGWPAPAAAPSGASRSRP